MQIFQSLKRERGRGENLVVRTKRCRQSFGRGAWFLVAPSLALQALIKAYEFDNQMNKTVRSGAWFLVAPSLALQALKRQKKGKKQNPRQEILDGAPSIPRYPHQYP